MPEADHSKLNHEFSMTGQLIPKILQKPQQVKVVQQTDYVLRAVLLDKGVITGEELNQKEAEFRGLSQPSDSPNRADAGGDSSDRGGETTSGSVRDTSLTPP